MFFICVSQGLFNYFFVRIELLFKLLFRASYAINICEHIESATTNTFFICFKMATFTKSLSVSYMGIRYRVTEKTA